MAPPIVLHDSPLSDGRSSRLRATNSLYSARSYPSAWVALRVPCSSDTVGDAAGQPGIDDHARGSGALELHVVAVIQLQWAVGDVLALPQPLKLVPAVSASRWRFGRPCASSRRNAASSVVSTLNVQTAVVLVGCDLLGRQIVRLLRRNHRHWRRFLAQHSLPRPPLQFSMAADGSVHVPERITRLAPVA